MDVMTLIGLNDFRIWDPCKERSFSDVKAKQIIGKGETELGYSIRSLAFSLCWVMSSVFSRKTYKLLPLFTEFGLNNIRDLSMRDRCSGIWKFNEVGTEMMPNVLIRPKEMFLRITFLFRVCWGRWKSWHRQRTRKYVTRKGWRICRYQVANTFRKICFCRWP